MKIWIIHDSKTGNGKILSEKIGEILKNKFDVSIGHVKEVDILKIIEDKPIAIIVGSPIRAGMSSMAARKFISSLHKNLKNSNYKIPYGAVFLTHCMEREQINEKCTKFKDLLGEGDYITQIFPEWISGKLKEVKGPFADGSIEEIENSVKKLLEWIK